MPHYVYIFGFETPDEARYNDRTGQDFQSSDSVVIEANDEAAALAWGNHVAERFLELLYRDSGMSWRDRGYVGWIEDHSKPSSHCWANELRVRVHELPDFTPWLRFHGEARQQGAEARHSPPKQRIEAAGIVSVIRKLLGRGSDR
jgi:hypothetical protein